MLLRLSGAQKQAREKWPDLVHEDTQVGPFFAGLFLLKRQRIGVAREVVSTTSSRSVAVVHHELDITQPAEVDLGRDGQLPRGVGERHSR